MTAINEANINKILGISESYQAPDKLKKIIFDRGKREKVFEQFLELDKDVSFDWFHIYFQEAQADRKVKKQDFTPLSIATVTTKIVGRSSSYFEPAAGTGGILIEKWWQDCLNHTPFDYRPSMYIYHAEELAASTLPFLLFNCLIRGMNSIIVSGDTLSRQIRQVYFVQNSTDNPLGFSSLNVMPHDERITKMFGVEEWIEDEIDHIEDKNMPNYLIDLINRKPDKQEIDAEKTEHKGNDQLSLF